MNIKKIIREEIQKLEEQELTLSKDEMATLHRDKEIEKDGTVIKFESVNEAPKTRLKTGFGPALGQLEQALWDVSEIHFAIGRKFKKEIGHLRKNPFWSKIPNDSWKAQQRLKKVRKNLFGESINESKLITEGTRWFVGVEMPNGKTTSTYGHWDGYPSWTGKHLKRYYSNPAKVKQLLKLGKNGISSIEKSMKGGKGHSFENPLPGESVFYGRDRGDKQRMVRNWKNKDSIKFNYYGAEFGYIWSIKDRKWYVKDDSSRTDWKVL